MLSLHTNSAAMSIQKTLGNTQSDLSTSMTRLGTGYRINSSKDDAAGLQIATRLSAQTRGMSVAMQNTQNASSMLQTADGAFGEVSNVLLRMKDLATQAADASSSDDDKAAMQAEYDALGKELSNVMTNTSYGGSTLLNGGKLANALTFQIGAGSAETMEVDFSKELTAVDDALVAATAAYKTPATPGTELTADANAQIDLLSAALKSVGSLRSSLGAAENRLEHVYNNLGNMSTNTGDAEGRIMDVDYASESANMTSKQILMQAGTAMLKQSSSMTQMVMSLIQ
ncbi:flagellin N-terminal helical domain-containing protein [Burkholderia sp. Ac-20379]|uniref:flagellin N-terminal helical domain-containing protein n=1 Tax=Burkholderia sp. Ac-20379 TaxID=2703900 RepID=UPI00197F03A6|nr:flagellin [Burkholderia sp. Ac-20379]MBN3729045.1 Lateral flagellin [Burkholderia sp. Ac-20379]